MGDSEPKSAQSTLVLDSSFSPVKYMEKKISSPPQKERNNKQENQ